MARVHMPSVSRVLFPSFLQYASLSCAPSSKKPLYTLPTVAAELCRDDGGASSLYVHMATQALPKATIRIVKNKLFRYTSLILPSAYFFIAVFRIVSEILVSLLHKFRINACVLHCNIIFLKTLTYKCICPKQSELHRL